ncbi:reductase-related protein isoform X1 [Aplysia californica]|uniref:Reductase-related protein isoform X1 n=1 Tax=Aplysia californica TaxID=6500 RepID=A0ABM1W3C1_APLCA|nr:reductase-related protein isoform X1 [Aplysia californica]
MASLVLVTDATSFISSHIIRQLQEDGCQVRGTVSSLSDEEERIKVLHELCPEAKFKVEVVEADPAKPESWESAMKDVQYVILAIKPTAAVPAATEGEAPTQPAVEAVLNVFKACVAAKSVKRVVLTSSYQAVCGAPAAPNDKVHTEADWADAETAEPLIKSVILAEKAAWDFVKELTDADKIELCVMNPTMPLGPPLIDAQHDIVRTLLDRGITGCPRVCYSVVDVRDVATAHAKALTLDEVAGNRHILHGANLWVKDAALALSKEFKPFGYSIPTISLPNVALWGLSLFNKTAKTFLPNVGKQSQFDNTRMKDVLGVTPRDVKDTVVDEANALIERGLGKKPKKVRNQGAAAAPESAEATKAEEEGAEKKEGEGEEKPKENGEVKDEDGEKKEEDQKDADGGDTPAPAAAGEGKTEESQKEEEKPAAEAVEEKKEEGGAGDAAPAAEEAKAEN